MASLTSAALATSDEARGRVEAEIAAWAASAQGRPLYEKYRDRRAYNHEICHRLAAAGVPPLAAAVLRRPWLYNLAGRCGRMALRWLPRFMVYGPWNPWGKQRELPTPPRASFRQLWQERERQRGEGTNKL
jgi:hypothetical protein